MSRNLEPGTTIPDFELPDENGVLHRLSDLQGAGATHHAHAGVPHTLILSRPPAAAG